MQIIHFSTISSTLQLAISLEQIAPQLTFSDLWGLTLTGTPASCVSPSSILLYVALSVSTRISPLYRRLTDFSVPICALRDLPSTKGESLESRVCSGSAASITNHLGKLSGESSVSESSDPGYDLFACRLMEDVEGFLVLMLCESFQRQKRYVDVLFQQPAGGIRCTGSTYVVVQRHRRAAVLTYTEATADHECRHCVRTRPRSMEAGLQASLVTSYPVPHFNVEILLVKRH